MSAFSPGVFLKTAFTDFRRACWGTTSPTLKSVRSSG